MISDDRIEEARRAGEKNKQTLELVQNWCRHIRVHAEGVGMLAQMTGLPIGHHSMSCEHAPAGRLSAWDMEQAALHFYDQNCVNCTFRKAVNVPNLMQLVTARDERQRQRQLEKERAEQEERNKLNARQKTRQLLRTKLDPIAASTIDLISELDTTGTKDAADKLVGAAELAPESFVSEIVEHLFWLVLDSGEFHLREPVFRTLAVLPIDQARLCDAAFRSFYGALLAAAPIIERYAALANGELIAPALPALINLAWPDRFPLGGDAVQPDTGPLRAVYKAHRSAVREALKSLLGFTDAHSARIAAQAINILSEDDRSLLEFGTDELMSKVARAKWLAQGRENEVSGTLADIRQTLVKSFHANPTRVDKILNEYLCGASNEGRKELFQIYQVVIRKARHSDEKITITEAHRIAFRHLITEAIKDNDDEDDVAFDVFHGEPYELTPLALEEIDLLLGSAAILATRLDALISAPLDQNKPFALLERMSAQNKLSGLLNSFLRWACVAAGQAGSEAIAKVLSTLHGLPEGRERLHAAIVGKFPKMARTIDGLQRILPDYYSALVGASQLVRAEAATAFGEMPHIARQNMPFLAFEAFSALMSDPYLIVHRAAIHALERFSLPDDFRPVAIRALSQWILYYSQNRSPDGDRFLVELVELYANRYMPQEKLKGSLGDRLIEILSIVSPELVMQESRRAIPVLNCNPNYPRFFLRLLEDEKTLATYHEDLLEDLRREPIMDFNAVRKEAVEVGRKVAIHYPWGAGSFIEVLTACGAWAEAAELMQAVVKAMPNSMQYRSQKLHFTRWRIACDYEAAVALGPSEKLADLKTQWAETEAAIKEDHDETERRRVSPARFFGEM